MENIEENYQYWKKKLSEEQEVEKKMNSRGEKINKLRAARERRETESSTPTSPASPVSTDINCPESASAKTEPGKPISLNPEKTMDPAPSSSSIGAEKNGVEPVQS